MKMNILTAYTDDQLYELFQPTECARCGAKLHESRTGMRRIGGDTCVCSSCYFEEIGKVIDEAPIGIPRMHR